MAYTDPSGELPILIPIAICAVAGSEIGGAWASNWKEWRPWKWDENSWKGATVGAIAGAGIGMGIGVGLSSLGVNVTGIYTGASALSSSTTLAWNIGSNALITANINMISSYVQGRDLDGVMKSGLVGLAAGAIGGFVGGLDQGYREMTQAAIRKTNLYTAALNGFGDRFTNSLDINNGDYKQAFGDGILGMAEGLYLAKYWGNKSFFTELAAPISRGNNPVIGLVGRYVSSAVTQGATSIPGFGLSIASYHATYSIYNVIFPSLADKIISGGTALNLITLFDNLINQNYSTAKVYPLSNLPNYR